MKINTQEKCKHFMKMVLVGVAAYAVTNVGLNLMDVSNHYQAVFGGIFGCIFYREAIFKTNFTKIKIRSDERAIIENFAGQLKLLNTGEISAQQFKKAVSSIEGAQHALEKMGIDLEQVSMAAGMDRKKVVIKIDDFEKVALQDGLNSTSEDPRKKLVTRL